MSLKSFKPYTKSTRGTVLVGRASLWKGKPFKSLVTKPILKNARLPKLIAQGFHAYQGHDDYKEIETLAEQWDVDIANVTGNWENLGGEKWNWITGEKIDRDR